MWCAPWRANELKFFDDSLDKLDACLKDLQKASSSIMTNISLLKRRLPEDSDTATEQKRRKTRIKENTKKSEKEKHKRLLNSANEAGHKRDAQHKGKYRWP